MKPYAKSSTPYKIVGDQNTVGLPDPPEPPYISNSVNIPVTAPEPHESISQQQEENNKQPEVIDDDVSFNSIKIFYFILFHFLFPINIK